MAIRQPIITVMGHVDHGKCVSGDTRIILADGTIKTAKSLYEEHSGQGKEEDCGDGFLVELRKPFQLLAFDGKNVTPANISHIWKRAADSLVKLELSNGDVICTTPEHPFLVFSDFDVAYKRADQIESSETILGPSSFSLNQNYNWKVAILERMAEADDFVIFLDNKLAASFFAKLKQCNHKDLRNQKIITTYVQSNRLRIKDFVNLVHYLGFDLEAAYDWISAFKSSTKKWRAGHTSIPISLPNDLQLYQLGYIFGAFAGDGSIKNSKLHNNDKEVQQAYQQFVKTVFSVDSTIKFGHTCWEVIPKGSKTLERFLTDIIGFKKNGKSASIEVPWICQASFECFRGFIEGWFDTDAYVSPLNYSIEFTSRSEKIVRESAILLAGLGIHARIYNKKGYWMLIISNKRFLEKFLDIFNPYLARRVETIKDAISKASTSRIFDKYALSGEFKKQIKESLNRKINERVPYFSKTISYKKLSGDVLRQICAQVTRPNEASTRMLSYFSKQLIGIEVKSKEIIKNKEKWVYDFTVPEFSNFIAERVVVHNTSLLDYIRSTTIVLKEAGAITQAIGASSVPLDVIKKLCGPLLEKFKLKFTIPGLLFIDTPGHEAFTNLRKRGGSVADIAIVVIDIMQGVQPQTKEAIELLKSFKVPFVVAANKVDLIVGWKTHSLIHTENFKKQIQMTKEQFERKLYELVGQLAPLGFDSEIYTKVDDYTKRVSIVPISAKTGEGIAELLALLTGLAQRYLESSLRVKTTGNAKGTILEIKEEKGLGTTADAIIYDGSLKVNDIILVGGLDKVIKTYVKGLLRPLPLVEMRAAGRKFEPVSEIHAATGVKIIAPELKDAIAGSPIVSAESEKAAKAAEKELAKEIEAITHNITTPGIVLKTDALGSLEALSAMLTQKGIPIQRMGIGPVNKSDVIQATANVEKSPQNTFVLGFNVPVEDDARELANKNGVTIINEPVIYHLIEKLEAAVLLKKVEQEKAELLGLVWPAKFRIIPGFVFRQTKPAVFGVEVMAGKLFPRTSLLTQDNRELGTIKSIEHEGEKLESLEAGKQAAISVDGVTMGRQLQEGDILFTAIGEEHFRKLKDKRKLLNKAELEVMKELAEIKRKQKPTWGL